MEQKDYYKILGITEEEKKLSGEEFNKVLSKKYRSLAMQYHPDKGGSTADMQAINNLYEKDFFKLSPLPGRRRRFAGSGTDQFCLLG